MRKITWNALGVLGLMLGLAVAPGCKTDEPGVKSNYQSQWAEVSASTEDATEAAEAVLNDLKLRDVKADATGIDGKARGFTADGTEVTVESKRMGNDVTQVSVYVGKMGDPELGKQILAQIRERLADAD